ncbi:MAG: ABC transporter ATP-binding protein/permease, partial [Planctomycetota bacterium]|nr:ABC transporter ATP-binding protein/permease [Planctomycetota bacterium]
MKDVTDKPLLHDLRRFYRYVRPYRYRALGAMFLTSFLGLFDAAIAWMMAPYMDNVIIKSSPGAAASIPASFFPILIIVFTLAQSAITFASNYLTTWVGRRIGNDVKLDLFDRLTHADTALFDQSTIGEVGIRFSGDADTATGSLLNLAKTFMVQAVTSVSLVAVMFYNSWILTLVAVGALLVTVIPLNRVRKKLKAFIRQSVDSSAVVGTAFTESYLGNRVITAYNLHSFIKERMRAGLDTLFRLTIKMVQRTSFLSMAMHLATAAGLAATVWLQGHLVHTGHMTPGNLVSFLTALLMFYTPIKKISSNIASFQTSTMAIQRVLAVLDMQPGIVSKPDAPRMSGIRNAIRYRDVSFSYETGKPVLKHVNLEIPAGSSVAFVGNSGGGKTTLVNLLPRFYDVSGGSVSIDGTDVRDIELESLRKSIAVVFQDNFLFVGTIRENILLGRRDATEEQLDAAVKAACLEEFTSGLEHGLDTQIGERGVMLSGGQKQRVAIARAFIRDAPIVILDEATSALDNQSEKVVQTAIGNLMENKTVLIIAHRLSTVIHADTIVVLRNGEIVETGKHDELLAANGMYASLYRTQLI